MSFTKRSEGSTTRVEDNAGAAVRRPSTEQLCTDGDNPKLVRPPKMSANATPTPSILGGTVDPESLRPSPPVLVPPNGTPVGSPNAIRGTGRSGRSPFMMRSASRLSRAQSFRARSLSGTWSNSHSHLFSSDSLVAKLWLLVIVYGVAIFVLQTDMMLPWGPGFSAVLVWVCSTAAGELLKWKKMPPLLGNLLAGMLLKNLLPDGNENFKSIRGLPDGWASDIITFGLTIIFLRGGLEIDLDMVRKAGVVATRLTIMPGVSEAIVVGISATMIFDMTFTLGISLGFILAAVSPAVVVGAMFELKKHGYGVAKNIPVLVVAAASFDDVVAISGFTIFISFAIGGGGNPTCAGSNATVGVAASRRLLADAGHRLLAEALAHNCSGSGDHSYDKSVKQMLDAFHGPITVALGLSLGVLCGRIAAMTKLWDLAWKRTLIIAGQGLFLSFGAKMLEARWQIEHAHPIGANTGILGALTMAGVSAYCWERGLGIHKDILAEGPNKEYQHTTESHLAELWNHVAQPLLFGVVGSYLDFREMPGETVGKAIATILAGLIARTTAAFFATSNTRLNLHERAFVAFAWMPKATVQAAFCGYPLSVIDRITASGGWADLEEQRKYEKWGQDILTTGVLAILMTAPAGLIFIQQFGPKWLARDPPSGAEGIPAFHEHATGDYEIHEFSDIGFLEEVPLVKRLLEVPSLVGLDELDPAAQADCDNATRRTQALDTIASFLKERTFHADEHIIDEGDEPDEEKSFYIIRNGQVKCTRNGVEVCTRLSRGDFFGELALMSNEKRAATVTAVNETTVLILGRTNFKKLLEPLSEYMIDSHAMLYAASNPAYPA